MPRDSHASTTNNALGHAGSSGPLAFLEASIPGLPNVLARTALYIVENPEKVVRFSLKELSGLCRAGEASIVRLCQMSGFDGFPPISSWRSPANSRFAIRRGRKRRRRTSINC